MTSKPVMFGSGVAGTDGTIAKISIALPSWRTAHCAVGPLRGLSGAVPAAKIPRYVTVQEFWRDGRHLFDYTQCFV
jgi:hypothetical protein